MTALQCSCCVTPNLSRKRRIEEVVNGGSGVLLARVVHVTNLLEDNKSLQVECSCQAGQAYVEDLVQVARGLKARSWRLEGRTQTTLGPRLVILFF